MISTTRSLYLSLSFIIMLLIRQLALLLVLAPVGHNAFQQSLTPHTKPFARSYQPTTKCGKHEESKSLSKLVLCSSEDDNSMNEVTKETADALRAADEALSSAQKARSREAAQLRNEAFASAVGGAVAGTVLGGIALVSIPDLADSVPHRSLRIHRYFLIFPRPWEGKTRNSFWLLDCFPAYAVLSSATFLFRFPLPNSCCVAPFSWSFKARSLSRCA